MASTHFQKLDEESRALAERWDRIARVIGIVALVSALVWGACASLRGAVHWVGEHVLEASERGGWGGSATLLAALLGGALARAWLYRDERWRLAAGDGLQVALENYQITYLHPGDDPTPRYERPAFSMAARKMVTTLLTLGSGASGGLEAPSVLVSESLAAGVARVLRIRSEHELRTYQLEHRFIRIVALVPNQA
jgi:CIC family chloride channel protein